MNSRFRRAVACAALSTLAAAACSQEREWKEEVALPDGNAIVIDRGVTFGPRNYEPGQSKTGAVKYWVSFKSPAGDQPIRWENPGKLAPMIFAISGGVPYVVAIPVSAYGYIEAGCPNPAYLFFRWSGDWQTVSFAELPPEIRNRNLLHVYTPATLAPVQRGFVSSSKVAAAYSGTVRYHQQIDPEWKGPPQCVLPIITKP
jgi:hypothetical protein